MNTLELDEYRTRFFEKKNTINSAVNEGYIFYPSVKNSKLKAKIGSPMSYLILNYLKSNYINMEQYIIQKDANTIQIVVDKKVIQTISCDLVGGNNIFGVVKASIKDKDLEDGLMSDVKILVDEERFLTSGNSLADFLGNLARVGDIRTKIEESMDKYGVVCYDRDGLTENIDKIEKGGLKGKELEGVISDVFATRIPLMINVDKSSIQNSQNGIDELSLFGSLEGKNTIEFKVLLNSIIGLSSSSHNPIDSATNYRDIDIFRDPGEINDFLKTIIEKAAEIKKVNQSIELMDKKSDDYTYDKNRLVNRLDGLYIDKGQTKTVTGITSSKKDAKKGKTKVIVCDDNKVLIMNKNFTITNGQHSTAFLTILYELIVNESEGFSRLKDKYGFTKNDLNRLFKSDGDYSFMDKIQELMIDIAKENNLDVGVEDIKNCLRNYKVSYKFVTEIDVATAQKHTAQSNKQKASSQNFDWLNTNKPILKVLSDEYKKYLTSVKDKLAKSLGDDYIFNIHTLKDIENDRRYQVDPVEYMKINDLYPYLNFMMNPKVALQEINNADLISKKEVHDKIIAVNEGDSLTKEMFDEIEVIRASFGSMIGTNLFRTPKSDDKTTNDILNMLNSQTIKGQSYKIVLADDVVINSNNSYKSLNSLREDVGDIGLFKIMSKMVTSIGLRIKDGINKKKEIPEIMLAVNILVQKLEKEYAKREKNELGGLFANKDRYTKVCFVFIAQLLENKKKELTLLEVLDNSDKWIKEINGYLSPLAQIGGDFNYERIVKSNQLKGKLEGPQGKAISKALVVLEENFRHIGKNMQINVTKKRQI